MDKSSNDAPTRLTKLLHLISAGASLGIRKSAGKQLGNLLASIESSDVVISVLSQLLGPLTSKVWESRMAASFAMECILRLNPNLIDGAKSGDQIDFDLDSVLSHCPELVASGGSEFDLELSLIGRKDFLMEQKKSMNQKLGITEGMGMDDLASTLVTDEDILTVREQVKLRTVEEPKKELSARERAMMKRQGRIQAQRTNSVLDPTSVVDPVTSGPGEENPMGLVPMAELSGSFLAEFFVTLQSLAVHSTWQARHGALLGLQSLLLAYDTSVLRSAELVHRLTSVLALDRFSDFNGDQVVAPVREAAAQCLGILAKSEDLKIVILEQTLRLCQNHAVWQVRHSGLTGLKYVIQSLRDGYTAKIYTVASGLLSDPDDDVKAASALIMSHLITDDEPADLDGLLDSLADLLGMADESSSTVGPVFSLLAKVQLSNEAFDKMAPLLLPFASSPSTLIRRQVFRLFNGRTVDSTDIFRLCCQAMLLETDRGVLGAAEQLALQLVPNLDPALMGVADLRALLLTPLDEPLDPRHCIFFRPGTGKSPLPAPHELGFKRADLMLLDREALLLGRRRLSRVLSSTRAMIVRQEDGTELGLMVRAWLGQCNQANNGSSVPTGLSLRATGILMAQPAFIADKALLIRSLLEEPLAEIQGDMATGLLPILQVPQDLVLFSEAVNKADPIALSGVSQVLAILRDPWDDILTLRDSLSPPVLMGFCRLLCGLGHVHFDPTLMSSIITSSLPGDEYASAVACLLALIPRVSPSLLETIVLDLLSMAGLGAVSALHGMCEDQGLLEGPLSAFVPLLTLPMLRWMSDANPSIRPLAASSFAQLVRLVPLSLGGCMVSFTQDGVTARHKDAVQFLGQLMGGGSSEAHKPVQPYDIPVPVTVHLRPYQQEGVSWLMFLRKYGLHGVLSDDMGLGKTLQTLCCLASDHHEHNPAGARYRSLVVCPSSLVDHWADEAKRYVPSLASAGVLVYTGPDRNRLLERAKSSALIISSYETVRNDVALLAPLGFSYIVLDEGHLIRNAKTKTAQAIKLIPAKHRLILSGTPIQNNVLELWALFDFLMPGFLGTAESAFMSRYGKAVLAVQPTALHASSAPSDGSDFDEAERKLHALHKQVKPFILRRMKQDVLKDLPPKIIQDYECEPSAIQKLLLDDFTKHAGSLLESEAGSGARMHVFQALQYLRKLCVHPALVYSDTHPLKSQIDHELARAKHSIHDLSLAPKLSMLRELLSECGIIGDEPMEELAANHRVLIFAQQKATLDLVVRDVLEPAAVPSLRIDGTTESSQRFSIADRFNADPSIPVLLLTTRVGGLGLNLTGADTVIFLEHDWNPQADLQAMDRAHRLGQKRTVNVYRLVMKGTLEERILGLQAFKKRVAGTVVTQQNAQTGPTSDLLDLFVPTDEDTAGPQTKRPKKDKLEVPSESGLPGWISSVLAESSGADPDAEYQQEFDLDAFVSRLKE